MRLRLLPVIGLIVAFSLSPLPTYSAEQAAATKASTSSLPFLSPVFSDNMVLQRDQPNTIWGWTQAGEHVRVEINGKSAEAVAGEDGRWSVKITPPAAGTDCTVQVDGSSQHAQLHHVLVGDVWLCSGQSNMEFGLPRAKNGAAEVAAANHQQIRIYKVGVR